MNVSAKLTGVDAAMATLKRLSKRAAANRALRRGMTKATRQLVKAAKGRVRRGAGPIPGLLRKSLGQKVKVGARGVLGLVGPRRGFLHVMADGTRVDPVRYGHIEEYGRAAVRAKKAKVLANGKQVFGQKVAPYRGRPFLRPAWDEERGAVMGTFAREVMAGVESECNKR